MDPFIATDPERVARQAALGAYEYIIVGGGFAGGVLAESLARKQKKVLLIEKGFPIFSTHICNTARPSFARGEDDSPEGNETIYNKLKSWVQLADGSDQDYAGGPLVCLGGRSLVWGLWTPRSSHEVLSANFPTSVVNDLESTYYDQAFSLVTNGSQDLNNPYPINSPNWEVKQQDFATGMAEVRTAVQSWIAPGYDLQYGTVATELVSSSPYRFPQGAYSTVESVLNRIYARDPYLTVIMGAEVLSLDLSKPSEPTKYANALTIRMTTNQAIHTIPTQAAKVILSAGTIPTAQIALASGLKLHNDLVGRGLIDHAIYAVRFARKSHANGSKDPMLFQTYIDLFKSLGPPVRALLTVTINNNFFLAGKTILPISQYLSHDGTTIAPAHGKVDMVDHDYDTIAILIEFGASLVEDNEVLNSPTPHPVIRLKRHELHSSEEEQCEMQNLATSVRNSVIEKIFYPDIDSNKGNAPILVPGPLPTQEKAPRLTLLPSGIFAHEVGTMRMPTPTGQGSVVTDNLLVKGFENLYACDASVLPYSVEANPSLTLTAITLRLADHLTATNNTINPQA